MTPETRVGFGRATITPEVPVYLAGFSARTEPATTVHDDLEAIALVIACGDQRFCLIVCDLLGMSPDVAATVRAAVGDAIELDHDRVLTACTHTHTGPSVLRGGERLGWPTPPAYIDALVAGCVTAARAAHAAIEPAALFHGRAPLPADASMNRRGLPYHPTFAVLDARRPDGTRVGTLANIGIHPVALGVQCLAVSTDWVGPFRAALAEATGGDAMLLQGALGDVNPRDPHQHDAEGDYDHAAALGRSLADTVGWALNALQPVTGEPGTAGAAVSRTIQAPTGPSLLTQLLEPGTTLPVELVEWSLGSVRLVSVPGEAFHALGQELLGSRDGDVLLAGLAPAWQGYFPHPWGEGYEEGVSYGRSFVDAVRAALATDPMA